MAVKRLKTRLIKRHRSYSFDEAARILGVAKGTLRRWVIDGLPILTDQRPHLILGADLIDFLEKRRSRQQKCKLPECFCFRCRTPRMPAFGAVEIFAVKGGSGNLRALCECCSTVMHKRVAATKLGELSKLVDVSLILG